MFGSVYGSTKVACLVSRSYGDGDQEGYWFVYHPPQEEELLRATEGYIAFGYGSPNLVFLVPVETMASWKSGMNVTERDRGMYWHVHINRDGPEYFVRLKPGFDRPDLEPYRLR